MSEPCLLIEFERKPLDFASLYGALLKMVSDALLGWLPETLLVTNFSATQIDGGGYGVTVALTPGSPTVAIGDRVFHAYQSVKLRDIVGDGPFVIWELPGKENPVAFEAYER